MAGQDKVSQQGLCVKPLLGGTIPRWPVCAGQLSCLVHRHSARRSGRSHGCTLTSDVGGAAERAKAGGLGGTHMTAVVGMHMPPSHTAGGMHNMGGMPLGGGMPGGLGGMPGMGDPKP